jgi:hypothetical protein
MERVAIHVNINDPVQVDMAFEVQPLFKTGKLTALQAAQIVSQTRGDEAICKENAETQWDQQLAWTVR